MTYANQTKEVLTSTPGSDKAKILAAIDGLYASGGTAGGDGIQRAYRVAENNFIKGGNNRIILATDGDFNIGISSPKELEKMIETKRATGIYLTVLGFGMGNYKDNRMQVLAEKETGITLILTQPDGSEKSISKRIRRNPFHGCQRCKDSGGIQSG